MDSSPLSSPPSTGKNRSLGAICRCPVLICLVPPLAVLLPSPLHPPPSLLSSLRYLSASTTFYLLSSLFCPCIVLIMAELPNDEQHEPDTRTDIRSIVQCHRYFWRSSLTHQLSLAVYDYNATGNQRDLLPYETMTMALNEVAQHKGQGFFFHVVDKVRWKSLTDSHYYPTSRKYSQPP